jgi:hypothetical protein
MALPEGHRVFALGMVRGEAEVKAQSFEYSADGQTGMAKILEQQS